MGKLPHLFTAVRFFQEIFIKEVKLESNCWKKCRKTFLSCQHFTTKENKINL